MANKRVFYAAKKAGLGPVGSAFTKSSGQVGTSSGSFRQIHGLQSVGITTTFNLEQTFELGQLAIYENIEGIPDVSIDLEKVLDGYAPIYVLATSVNGDGTTDVADNKATAATMIGRSKAQCDFCLAIYKDTDETAINTSAAGSESPEAHVMMSGVFVNSVSYNVGTDGYATESVTLVGQDKVWHSHFGAASASNTAHKARWNALDLIGAAEDSPLALTQGSGGVNRREDVIFTQDDPYNSSGASHFDVNGAVSGFGTILPREIPGISASGTNDRDANDQFKAHISSFTCSTDLGREDIFELGRRGRYHRFVPFPTEVTCEISSVSASGDLISATEEGTVDVANGANLTDQTIRLNLREGLIVDLGTKNKLSNVSVTGGDAGGGNEEITYSYTNFNDFTVYHPQDPNAVKRGMLGWGANTFTAKGWFNPSGVGEGGGNI